MTIQILYANVLQSWQYAHESRGILWKVTIVCATVYPYNEEEQMRPWAQGKEGSQ
jgi:hypothetical protein